MSNFIPAKVTTTLVNGEVNVTDSSCYMGSDDNCKVKEKIDIKTVLNNTRKELADFINIKYDDNAGYWIDGFDLGDGVCKFTVVGDFTTEIFVHPSHVGIKEMHSMETEYGKTVDIVEEHYITCTEDGILRYEPRETHVFIDTINNEITGKYPLDEFNQATEISVNFEGGWTHAFTSLPSPVSGTSVQRYVGSNNDENVVYTDLQSEYKDNRLIKQIKIPKVFLENVDLTSVAKEEIEYIYEE